MVRRSYRPAYLCCGVVIGAVMELSDNGQRLYHLQHPAPLLVCINTNTTYQFFTEKTHQIA